MSSDTLNPKFTQVGTSTINEIKIKEQIVEMHALELVETISKDDWVKLSFDQQSH